MALPHCDLRRTLSLVTQAPAILVSRIYTDNGLFAFRECADIGGRCERKQTRITNVERCAIVSDSVKLYANSRRDNKLEVG